MLVVEVESDAPKNEDRDEQQGVQVKQDDQADDTDDSRCGKDKANQAGHQNGDSDSSHQDSFVDEVGRTDLKCWRGNDLSLIHI